PRHAAAPPRDARDDRGRARVDRRPAAARRDLPGPPPRRRRRALHRRRPGRHRAVDRPPPPRLRGPVLTRDDSARAVAVLTDRTADGVTTLTGYRLRGAEHLWGPVAVPGPPVGPGLLVAEADGSGRAV